MKLKKGSLFPLDIVTYSIVVKLYGKFGNAIVGFSACVLFNTPGPLLHLGPPGPGPLVNPGGRYPTMDG